MIPVEGLVEVWRTKSKRVVLVFPVCVHDLQQPNVEPERKMLWFDEVEKNWNLSNLENRLEKQIGVFQLLDEMNGF